MASNITLTGYNEAYPVAGQDNDSQGFRTNFSVTKAGLETASTEITTLQSSTAKLNADNDFNGSKIQEAEMQANTETVYANGAVGTSQNITGDVTLTIADLPVSGKLGKMRLEITANDVARTVIFAGEGGATMKTDANFPDPFIVTSSSNPMIIDFWTTNGGTSLFAQSHGVFT
jgi:outer membrane murein-binding lipoprotein Lpp